ncbi:WD40 repeat domain-containing protein [Nocardioides panacisoli]|uniref:WD40 repeat domain-containing protein n=1 Tax=Nocardioides panacisoli TaxID=627624 RepID=A0ABP7IB74_9ACTN
MHGLLAALVATPFVAGVLAAPADRPAHPVFAFQDPEIDESSGLVVRDGLFVTVNDSGDTARVFVVDPATGETVGRTSWDADPIDDEALAPAAHSTDVWVGDIGDNLADRDSITITRVPTGRGELSGAVASYRLEYPDGAHDAETLMVDPVSGQVLIASKGFMGSIYAAPEQLTSGTNELKKVGEAPGIATDGAFFPDGKHLVIRDYDSATFYTYPGLEEVGEMTLPAQQQGEGIAVAPDGKVYVCSEGVESPVLEVAIPDRIRSVLDGDPHHPSAGPRPADDVPATTSHDDDRSPWPWAIGGGALVAIVLVLLRALRPR